MTRGRRTAATARGGHPQPAAASLGKGATTT